MDTKPDDDGIEIAEGPCVLVILDGATIETTQTRDRGIELLNCDDDIRELRTGHRKRSEARPDITHQCLLHLLDSPLNKAGRLRVYVRTAKNVLIQINPRIRLPRTFKRFSGLMTQLLCEHRIRAVHEDGRHGEMLMKLVKNPVTDHLPDETLIVGCTADAPPPTRLRPYVASALARFKNVAFVVGAFPHGEDRFCDLASERVCLSAYPLTAAGTCAKITEACEEVLGVL